MEYHQHTDHKFTKNLRRGASESVDAFIKFDQAVFAEGEGRLDVKTRELIAIGIAATTQCPYCIEAHTKAAWKAGATESEVSEAVMVSSALRAGGSFTHGWMAMKFYNQAVEAE